MKNALASIMAICSVVSLNAAAEAQSWQMLGQKSVASTARTAEIAFDASTPRIDQVRLRVQGPIRVASVELELADGGSYVLPIRAALSAGANANISLPIHATNVRSASVLYRPAPGASNARSMISVLGRSIGATSPASVRVNNAPSREQVSTSRSVRVRGVAPARRRLMSHRAASLARPRHRSVARLKAHPNLHDNRNVSRFSLNHPR